MADVIGKTISHFRIIEQVGQGGMGEVYLAEDTKLKRKTALKFLPSNAISTEEDKKRFIQEAQAAAALNHPNIATVYGIDEYEGNLFIAMEFIEGQTIQDKIKSGPLNLRDVIDIAIQIAGGLQDAHEKGIIHRDIKSANIMLTEKGQVKIMDFGLARRAEHTRITRTGVTVGTAAFLSPEQAQGGAIDHRTDCWSFGVVLYEMVTGQLPFKGEYEQAMIYSIINDEPEPVTGLRTGVPIELERIVFKLLAKDPNKRYQHIDELPVDLGNLDLTNRSPHISKNHDDRIDHSFVELKRSSWKIVIPIFVLTAVLIFFTGWFFKPQKKQGPPTVSRFTIHSSEGEEVGGGSGGSIFTISPDGTKIVYIARINNIQKLYLRQIGELKATPLENTGGALFPFFSPDSRELCFYTDGKLKRVHISGGPPVTICDIPYMIGGSWGDNGDIIFSNTMTLLRVSASGGIPEVLTKQDTNNPTLRYLSHEMLPGGKGVLYTVLKGTSYDDANIALLSLETLESSTIIEGGIHPQYSPTGHITFARDGSIWAVPFDIKRLKITGEQIPILNNVAIYGNGIAQFRYAKNGTFVYIPNEEEIADRSLVLVSHEGIETQLSDTKRNYFYPRFSPDGKSVAFIEYIGDTRFDIWQFDITRKTYTRLTSDKYNNLMICWTPDGKLLTFISNRYGVNNIFLQRVRDSGSAKQLFASSHHQNGGSWSSDGTLFSFYEIHPITGGDLWIYTTNDSSASVYLNTKYDEKVPAISPDGKWIVYQSNKSGQDEIYITPYPGPILEEPVSTKGGTEPIWSPDGREIFYRENNSMMKVTVETKPTLSLDIPKKLFEGDYLASGFFPYYDIHPDGDHFLMVKDERKNMNQMIVVLNWFEELKEKFETEDK